MSGKEEKKIIVRSDAKLEDIRYRQFKVEDGITNLIKMIEPELSEPYSIFLYRHFINDYPDLTIIATHEENMIGCIVGKIEDDEESQKGYIAMLVVDKAYRKKGIAKALVNLFSDKCKELGIFEVELETECVNKGALRLYEVCGFVRERLFKRYYQNGNDAFRLKLYLHNEKEAHTHEHNSCAHGCAH